MYQTEPYVTVPIAPQIRSKLDGVCVLGARLSLQQKPEHNADFWTEWTRLHELWKGKKRKEVEQHPYVQAYRSFYSRMDLNPDRNPPSVQALVQRFLLGDVLSKVPVIHPIVDAVNVAAVETMVPLGVFDANFIAGDIVLDLSWGGESFQAIGCQPTHLEKGMIVLRDDEKVLSQFCYRDSEAQKVTEQTQTIWLLGCQVPGIATEQVTHALSRAIEHLDRQYIVQPW